MERQLKEVDSTLSARNLPPQTGLLVSQMSRYGGPGSMYHELLTRAGIKNAIAEVGVANGQLLSQELIVKSDPDFFFVSADRESDETGAGKFRDSFWQIPPFRICVLTIVSFPWRTGISMRRLRTASMR